MPRKASHKKKVVAQAIDGKLTDPKDVLDPDAHPFKVGSWLVVRWLPDASDRLCTVVERARVEDPTQAMPSIIKATKAEVEAGAADASRWRYYVHYADFNRRMDEWVKPERVIQKPVAANALASVDANLTQQDQSHASSTSVTAPVSAAVVDTLATDVINRGNAPPPHVFAGGSGALAFGTTRKRHRADLDALTSVEDMEHDEHEGLDEASLREHEEVTKVKNVGVVELGRHTIETWYFSPYPKEYYPGGYVDTLYVCEVTFSFFRTKAELLRSQLCAARRAPPGDEIYRKGELAMFEVDGNEHGEYCQNLCYFAKLFLDHKTLYFDVDPFLFYVLCEVDTRSYHPVGFYSKEKYSEVGYNLACILAFPPYQRKGYGRFLIAFSYALSRTESKVGAPEKPLSDLGHIAYRSYWASTLLDTLKRILSDAQAISIMELSKMTSIMADDVAATLQYLGVVRQIDGVPILWCPPAALDALVTKHPVKPPIVDVKALHWTPFHTDIKRDKFSIRAKRPTADGLVE
eukprot:CAMPEP_0119274014 /NCGR_PEP_ID=MMETSP1329-20130426/11328_1 /TAXON_ID=114041 /ORGANISM="Genus nov. species nov., Strain RCC1024" /LENGTH=519 /DNA_ID=CAMNT_0007274289 /DNA_START=168 /DNA_END=1727 /DNA_ORIENTATION=-